jgi:F-type H+-transporting ATPase subunit b
MANSLILLAHAAAEAGAEHGGGHAEPVAFGLNPAAWVALAMIVLLLFAFLGAKVHQMLGKGLDGSIAEIRKQLDEAKQLRAEAEALRKEYADKIANAEKDAASMIEHAGHEADAIIAKAESDTTDMIARREKMASDNIHAAELAAVADLRAKAAQAATAASRKLIAEKHTAEADKALVDQAIGSI